MSRKKIKRCAHWTDVPGLMQICDIIANEENDGEVSCAGIEGCCEIDQDK